MVVFPDVSGRAGQFGARWRLAQLVGDFHGHVEMVTSGPQRNAGNAKGGRTRPLHQNEVRNPAVTTHGSKPGVTVAYVEFSNPKPCVE